MALSLLQKALVKAHIRAGDTAAASALVTAWARRDPYFIAGTLFYMGSSITINQKKLVDETLQAARIGIS